MKIINPASVIYLRKSREDSDLELIHEGETLARHKKRLLAVSEKLGLNVTKIYEEIVSGDSIDERPQVQKLINELLQNKYQNVVVMEIQRIARGNTKDQGIVLEALEMSKAKIVTPERVYDPTNEQDMEMIEFSLMLSRRELKAISRRMRSGFNTSVHEGNYLAPVPPYGYDIWKRGRRDRILKINEHESEIVKKIFKLSHEENMSLGEIARTLNNLNIPTRLNAKWQTSSVRSILTNITYTGKIRWNYRNKKKEYIDGKIQKKVRANDPKDVWVIEGKHKAIIDDEVFVEVQKQFKNRVPTGSKTLKNPLAGLLRCKECGLGIALKPVKNTYSNRYGHNERMGCTVKSCLARVVVAEVLDALQNKVKEFEIELKGYNPQIEKDNYLSSKKILETEAEKLEKKKLKLFDLFEDEVYTKDEFLDRKGKIIDRLSQIYSSISELTVPNENLYELKIVKFNEVIASLKSDHVPVVKKNALLKSVIDRIEYTNTKDIPEVDIFFK